MSRLPATVLGAREFDILLNYAGILRGDGLHSAAPESMLLQDRVAEDSGGCWHANGERLPW